MGDSRARAEAPARYIANTLTDASPARIAEGEKVIAWFLDALPKAACLAPPQIIIVVDAIRPQIYDEAELAAARASYFGRLRDSLIAEAGQRASASSTWREPMRTDYARAQRPFEFPTDAHWNSHAHGARRRRCAAGHSRTGRRSSAD